MSKLRLSLNKERMLQPGGVYRRLRAVPRGKNCGREHPTTNLPLTISSTMGLVLPLFGECAAPQPLAQGNNYVNQGAERVVVITTMMTPWETHSEVDTSQAVEAATKRHPTVEIVDAWPHDFDPIAAAFAGQTRRFDAR